MKDLSNFLETNTIITGTIALISTDKIIAYLTIISISLAIILKIVPYLKKTIAKLKEFLKDKKLDHNEKEELKQDFKELINDIKEDIKGGSNEEKH